MPADPSFNHRRLRAWRDASGMSAEEIAHRARITYPYLRALETGKRTPTVPTIARLAAVFGKDPGELIIVESAIVADAS